MHVPHQRKAIRIRIALRSVDPFEQIVAIVVQDKSIDQFPAKSFVCRGVVYQVGTNLGIGWRAALLVRRPRISDQRQINGVHLWCALPFRGSEDEQVHHLPRHRLVTSLAEGTAETNLVILPRSAVDTDDNVHIVWVD